MMNQKEVPSVTGDVVPEYVSSLKQYKKMLFEKYSWTWPKTGADKCFLFKDWADSRGVIFRFHRKSIEIRVMDEQECIKSDVALSCFIKAVLSGVDEKQPETFIIDEDTIHTDVLNKLA